MEKGLHDFITNSLCIQFQKGKSADTETQPYVVQSYINRPYLIGGKKFDMRLYILVTSVSRCFSPTLIVKTDNFQFRPLTAWIHREGFARFSHSRYSNESCEDACKSPLRIKQGKKFLVVHLTNVAIAKAAADYDPERGLKWSLDKLKRYIHACRGHEAVRLSLVFCKNENVSGPENAQWDRKHRHPKS